MPDEIKSRLISVAGLDVGGNGSEVGEELPDKVRKDLQADEADPSRIVPSAEGVVTFAGLSADMRDWVHMQLDDLRARENGGGHAKKRTNGGDHSRDAGHDEH